LTTSGSQMICFI